MLFEKKSGVQWMLVFLGNPGKKYANTRHNVGFMTAGILEKKLNVRINRIRFNALTATASLGNEKLLLLKPQTFINLSGNAVAPAAAYYRLPPERIIVVCDDVAIAQGRLRIRKKGSSGGHNGLKSIIAALDTEEFPRIRIGVGAPARDGSENPMIDWVLGEFHGRDLEEISESCLKAAEAAMAYITEGPDRAMNKFN